MKYCIIWKITSLGLNMMRTIGVHSVVCRRSGKSLQQTEGVWVTKPFTNWKKAVEKMKDHEKSHFRAQVNMAYFAV